MGKRVFIIVIDALGVGALPDAPEYGDAPGANTLGSIDAHSPQLNLPTMAAWGLGHITPMRHIAPTAKPQGFVGKMAEQSKGKDTTTGHWEMMGLILDKPFRTYPDGFPPDVIQAFLAKTGCDAILGNVPASGTEIIERYGKEHLETGRPIVYTSADSVFQIAAHIDRIPLETLYAWCAAARDILRGEHEVSRVIARPFNGEPGNFQRLGGDRRDYAVAPPAGSCLDAIRETGGIVLGVGKIEDIFCQVGITHAIHTNGNTHGIEVTRQLAAREIDLDDLALNTDITAMNPDVLPQCVFVNLVDTDMKYGHRRDVPGYAAALEEIDAGLAQLWTQMTADDLILITGDHGCDPTAPGSDHTREYVPILMASPAFSGGGNLGTRATFADIGRTTLDWLNIPATTQPGQSMLPEAEAAPAG